MYNNKSEFVLYPNTIKGRNVFETRPFILRYKDNSKVIQHKKLNTLFNPCEESHDYNFQNCIYAKIISKIGCQPYWLDHIKTDIENCSKASKLDYFLRKMGDIIKTSTEKELRDEYECLNPCNHMEYKVYDF